MTKTRCDSCGLTMDRPARDECKSAAHRSTNVTLGLREASCSCCVVVDLVALNLLRGR